MAARRSLNRRSLRYSRYSVGSGILDPNTHILDDEHPLWWENLENDPTFRRSVGFDYTNRTSGVLDPSSRLDNSKTSTEWWNELEMSDKEVQAPPKTPTAQSNTKHASRVLEVLTSESEQETGIQKSRPKLRATRKSHGINAFTKALNETSESNESEIANKKTNASSIQRSILIRKHLQDESEQSDNLDKVIKSKPGILTRRHKTNKSKRQSENIFRDALQEHSTSNADLSERVSKTRLENNVMENVREEIVTGNDSEDISNNSFEDALETNNILHSTSVGHVSQTFRNNSIGNSLKEKRSTRNKSKSVNPLENVSENDTPQTKLIKRSRNRIQDILKRRSLRRSMNRSSNVFLDALKEPSNVDSNENIKSPSKIKNDSKKRSRITENVTENNENSIEKSVDSDENVKSPSQTKNNTSKNRSRTVTENVTGNVENVAEKSVDVNTLKNKSKSSRSTNLSRKSVDRDSNPFLRMLEEDNSEQDDSMKNISKRKNEASRKKLRAESEETDVSKKNTRKDVTQHETEDDVVSERTLRKSTKKSINKSNSGLSNAVNEHNDVRSPSRTKNNVTKENSQINSVRGIEITTDDSESEGIDEPENLIENNVLKRSSKSLQKKSMNKSKNNSFSDALENRSFHDNSVKSSTKIKNDISKRTIPENESENIIDTPPDNSKSDKNQTGRTTQSHSNVTMPENNSQSSTRRSMNRSNNSLSYMSEDNDDVRTSPTLGSSRTRKDTNKRKFQTESTQDTENTSNNFQSNGKRSSTHSSPETNTVPKRNTQSIAKISLSQKSAQNISEINTTSKGTSKRSTKKSMNKSNNSFRDTSEERSDAHNTSTRSSNIPNNTSKRKSRIENEENSSKNPKISTGNTTRINNILEKNTEDTNASTNATESEDIAPLRISSSNTLNSTKNDKQLNQSKNASTIPERSNNPRKKVDGKINDFFKPILSMPSSSQSRTNSSNPSNCTSSITNEQFAAAREKLEQIKKREMEIMKKISERETIRSVPLKLKRLNGRTKTSQTNTKDRQKAMKEVDKAYIVNGQVYKRPKLPRPKHWATDRLYRHLWKCMESKYKSMTRVRSEKFVLQLAEVVTIVGRRKKYENYKLELDGLMKEMARLCIIRTRNDFYDFCYDFLPYEFRVKATPILLPGNKRSIPYDPETLHTPLLNDE